MTRKTSVAVGSMSSTKIGATEDAFFSAFPGASVEGVAVASGVSVMPMSDRECIAGARNRARAARKALGTDFGVGLEGGVHEEPTGLMLAAWVVITHRNGEEGIACTAKIPIPERIADQIRNGAELGPLIREIAGEGDPNLAGSASGVLSGGLVSRRSNLAHAVKYAMGRFVAPDYYR